MRAMNTEPNGAPRNKAHTSRDFSCSGAHSVHIPCSAGKAGE